MQVHKCSLHKENILFWICFHLFTYEISHPVKKKYFAHRYNYTYIHVLQQPSGTVTYMKFYLRIKLVNLFFCPCFSRQSFDLYPLPRSRQASFFPFSSCCCFCCSYYYFCCCDCCCCYYCCCCCRRGISNFFPHFPLIPFPLNPNDSFCVYTSFFPRLAGIDIE